MVKTIIYFDLAIKERSNMSNNKSFEHLNLLHPKVQFGFTLAEVLITLGIIGVVAAMTIPVLITNYQKHVTVTKLQKAISILNQAYKLSYDEVGELSSDESFNIGANKYFETYWAPYIKTAIVCKTYQQCGYKKVNPWSMPNGLASNISAVYDNFRVTFYTSDGFLYLIFTGGGNADDLVKSYQVYVDINGGEGPNIYGRDLFVLTRSDNDGAGVYPACISSSNNTVNSKCSQDNATCCAEKIRRAGWKIEKDYPWK